MNVKTILTTGVIFTALGLTSAFAGSITAVSWGGAYTYSQVEAWFRSYDATVAREGVVMSERKAVNGKTGEEVQGSAREAGEVRDSLVLWRKQRDFRGERQRGLEGLHLAALERAAAEGPPGTLGHGERRELEPQLAVRLRFRE